MRICEKPKRSGRSAFVVRLRRRAVGGRHAAGIHRANALGHDEEHAAPCVVRARNRRHRQRRPGPGVGALDEVVVRPARLRQAAHRREVEHVGRRGLARAAAGGTPTANAATATSATAASSAARPTLLRAPARGRWRAASSANAMPTDENDGAAQAARAVAPQLLADAGQHRGAHEGPRAGSGTRGSGRRSRPASPPRRLRRAAARAPSTRARGRVRASSRRSPQRGRGRQRRRGVEGERRSGPCGELVGAHARVAEREQDPGRHEEAGGQPGRPSRSVVRP